jgi:AcrR family transcriptional regulator
MANTVTPSTKEERPSRRERKKKELWEAIYNAAIELFIQKGFDNVTIEDITEKVDIAKGTFFNYFSSKDSILPYFLSKHLAEVRERLPKETKRIKSARGKLQHLFSLLAKLVIENELLIKWVLMESFRLKVYQKEKEEVFGNILRIMVQILKEGQEKGEFNQNMDPEKIAEILESIFFFSSMRWLTYENYTPLAEDLFNKVNYFLDGIKV